MNEQVQFKVVVIGSGHAGIEAALACARMGLSTAMVTLNPDRIGAMPCNPSIGGPAKGTVTREIDALGGEQGRAADATMLQIRMLNSSKGPGVWALRAQNDKESYRTYMKRTVQAQTGLTLIAGEVTQLERNENNTQIAGVRLADGTFIAAEAVIVTSGTYMESATMRGHTKSSSGPEGEQPSRGLSGCLKNLGFELIRLKTGTPPRIHRDSVDFNALTIEKGDERPLRFSRHTSADQVTPLDKQLPCWSLYTQPETHQMISENIGASAMYGGVVTGVGPRYCPSIEDKITRFADKPRHQLFLEPESRDSPSLYLGGFSTSFPAEFQERLVRTLPGLSNCQIMAYAYAIEYDAINPIQLYPTLESKLVPGLYFAGQVNGTSGYEEAACQGLMAGINAALKVSKQAPLVLKRHEAYIGVLIDDLTTKGVSDPYRLLTSRAEHRLALRNDNAEQRLSHYGHRIGLISAADFCQLQDSFARVDQAKQWFSKTVVKPSTVLGRKAGIATGITAATLMKRPEFTFGDFACPLTPSLSRNEQEQVEIELKFEGYIMKQQEAARIAQAAEAMLLHAQLDFAAMENISLEAREKLTRVRPLSVGQAARISGITPADLAIVIFHQRQFEKSQKGQS